MALPSNKKRKIFDGRYEVLAIVGRGTDSVVYHARHAGSPTQEVALKVLLNQPGKVSITERLRKEALTLVSCRHRYVVRLDDFHSLGELCYLSMEYAPEKDLRKYAATLGQPISPEIGERFLRQTLEALQFVHSAGVIHRDIKPDNILVMNEKESRLADFGLALLPGEDTSLDEIQSGVGSFGYLPPELLEGIRYDERSDLYALGLSFYEALSGTHPFENLPLAMQLEGRADDKVKPLHEINPQIPAKLSNVISKMMRFDAVDRFQNAAEALIALNEAEKDTSTEASLRAVEPPPVAEPLNHSSNGEDSQVTSRGGAANSDIPAGAATTTTAGNAALAIDEAPVPEEKSAKPEYEGERIPQPTEKIDLERIKEIIAKDAKQKAEAAARRAARERSAAQAAQKAQAAHQGKPRPQAPPPALADQGSRSEEKKKSFSFPLDGLMAGIPRSIRPIAVALGAAIITIAGVSLASLLLPSDNQPSEDLLASSTPEGAEPQKVRTPESQVPQSGGESPSFPALAGGMYAGTIEGVIPGTTSPFALISLEKQEMLAVIVGIEGWTPVLVSTAPEAEAQPNTVVVRTNGAILNITGTTNSDTIKGTFTNAVTGDSGQWQVKKVS